jgi:ABC-2 type transport system permease protein
MSARSAVARRVLADSRARTSSFALLFALVAYANAVGYRHSYPSLQERLAFARSFGANRALQLFYGVPHDLLTVGGYTAWRLGGIGSIISGAWGLLGAVRALRTEEDAGRQELVLAGAVSRRSVYAASLAAIGIGAAIIWLAIFLGLVSGRLPLGGSAYLALATISPIVVFGGVGALASQLAPNRRLALELGSATLALAFLVRVIADISTGLGCLRWATPLGWAEELQPFAHPQPAVLGLPAVVGALLLTGAGWIAVRRDVGAGLLQGSDTAPPRLRLLSSPTALAFRDQRAGFAVWLAGIGLFALIIGVLSTSFTAANLPANLREELHKLGGASLTTPAGALGFYFLLFAFVISLFASSQIAAVRREEADQQLETLFALPVDRRRWLASRLLLAAAGVTLLALSAGTLAWIGAASQNAHVPLLRLLEAGANCIPAAVLFLALATLAFALLPRASSGIAYSLVVAAFVWQLLGALLGAPRWLLDLTPFQHIGLVPALPFRTTAAVSMLAIAAGVALVSAWALRRRDLTGA